MYFARHFKYIASLNLHNSSVNKTLESYSFNKEVKNLVWQKVEQGFEPGSV